MVQTKKFSAFTSFGIGEENDTIVGIDGGVNARFQLARQFGANHTTATRPLTPPNAYIAFNTDLQEYEFYDAADATWYQLITSNFTPPVNTLNAIVRWDGLGELLNSSVLVDDSGNIQMDDETGIMDLSGNYHLQFDEIGTPVSHVLLTQGSVTQSPTIGVAGAGANIALRFQNVGAASYLFLGNTTRAARLSLLENSTNGTDFISIAVPEDVTTSYILTLPAAPPSTNGQVLSWTTAGVGSFVSAPTVTLPTVDMTVARFDGTAGALEDSGVVIDDSDNVTGVTSLAAGVSTALLTIGATSGLVNTQIVASGSTADINIEFANKGAATFVFRGTTSRAARVLLRENTTNGTHSVGLAAAEDVTANYVITLPAAAPTANGQVATTTTAGVQTWSGTAIAATNGISFGSGNGTLNFYDARTNFTPTITFSTPGDLSVVYTTQAGVYTRIGDYFWGLAIVAFTPTYTTASGTFSIAGFPYASASTVYGTGSSETGNTTYPAGRTYVLPRIGSSTTSVSLVSNGTGVTASSISTANMASGLAQTVRASISYPI